MRHDYNNQTRTDFVYSFDSSQSGLSTYDAYPVTAWCRNTTLLLPRGDSELSAVDCHISSEGGCKYVSIITYSGDFLTFSYTP